MGEHTNHRQRLRERFLREGLDNFNDINTLELLLFYCVPRRDTNLIAHRLVDYFGNVAGVLEAKPEELQKVAGVGEHVSTYLSLIRQASRYYQIRRSEPGDILVSLDACGKYLLPYFIGQENEMVYLLCLDAKCKVICCRKAGEGSVNSASISVRRIVEMALDANASTVVLAHNHPSGLALPSPDDIQTTHKLAHALTLVDVTLADHIVVSGDDFVSIVQSRYYQPEAAL